MRHPFLDFEGGFAEGFVFLTAAACVSDIHTLYVC